MFKYDNQELRLVKPKTAGKNRNPVDGFYETTGDPKKKYFIKKPADQRELFIEGLIGRFYSKLKEKGFIDEKYHRSLICADFIKCEDGSYALIQPCEEFIELYKLIGSGYKDGSDRDPMCEMTNGPSLYPKLTQQGKYFGLSLVLMLDLLVGNYSVHSGNIVVFKKSGHTTEEGEEIKQFAGIDNGAANRYFAHPDNNKDILVPYEYQGAFNYAWFTKGYIANYKNIKGLHESMAKHADALKQKLEQQISFSDLMKEVFAELPPDLLKETDREAREKLAKYICIPAFKTATFGPDGNFTEVLDMYAKTLDSRLEQLCKLKGSVNYQGMDVYQSTFIEDTSNTSSTAAVGSKLTLSMDNSFAFPERLDAWLKLIKESKNPIEYSEIDYASLVAEYNHFVNRLGREGDLDNWWGHNSPSSHNILVPSNEVSKEISPGYAFIPQYREGTILRRLYTLSHQESSEGDRFAPYGSLNTNYRKANLKTESSTWLKITTTLEKARDVIKYVKELQDLEKKKREKTESNTVVHPVTPQALDKEKEKETESSADAVQTATDNLLHALTQFQDNSNFITELLTKDTKEKKITNDTSSDLLEKDTEEKVTNDPLFFYPISDEELKKMSGDQLLTICFEELYSTAFEIEPSQLLARIICNDTLWDKANSAYSEDTFGKRRDNPKEKIVRLRDMQGLVSSFRILVKDFHKSASLLKDKELLFQHLQGLIGTLPHYLQAELQNEFKEAESLLTHWQKTNKAYLDQEIDYTSAKIENKASAYANLNNAFELLPTELQKHYRSAFENYKKEVDYLSVREKYMGTVKTTLFVTLKQKFDALPSEIKPKYKDEFELHSKENAFVQCIKLEQIRNLNDKINQFPKVQTAFAELSPELKNTHKSIFNKLKSDHENIYLKLQDNRIVPLATPIEKIDKVLRLIQNSVKISQAAVTDKPLWNAITNCNKQNLPQEIAEDLLKLQQYRVTKVKEYSQDKQVVGEINAFYADSLRIRLSDKPIKIQVNELTETANQRFSHRDKDKRILADTLMLISILFGGLGLAIMAGRAIFCKSVLFSTAPTAREEALVNSMVKSDELDDDMNANHSLFTATATVGA